MRCESRIFDIGATLDVPIDQVRRNFEINTFAVLRLAQAVIPHMAKRRRGLFVTIGSVSGNVFVIKLISFLPPRSLISLTRPTPWNGVYAAAKAAVHSLTEILWMECKPLNVDVMLVAPGAVQSNLAANQSATFDIPESSLYKSYRQNMIDRIYISQKPGASMPAKEFASQVVGAALSSSPPRYMTLGPKSFVFYILEWLPRTWVLSYLWKLFSKLNK